MKTYFKIKKAELQPDKFGNYIKITMIGLYEVGTDKWIKWVKLDESVINILLNSQIN